MNSFQYMAFMLVHGIYYFDGFRAHSKRLINQKFMFGFRWTALGY